MQELIDNLKNRFDLTEEKAREIAETVIEQVESKLPEPIAGKLQGLLSGDNELLSELQSKLGSLGGMFKK